MSRFAIALCAGVLSTVAYGLEDPEVDIAKKLGDEIVTLLKTAPKMAAYCRKVERGETNAQDKVELYDEKVIRGKRLQDIAAVILKNETWSSIKLECKPNPGYLLWFSDGSNYADFLVCFECGLVQVTYHSKETGASSGATLDFRSTKEFKDWVRETFPNDPRLNK